MRIRLLAVLVGMLLGFTGSALAQNPEEGEVGELGGEMGGEFGGEEMGDEEMGAPSDGGADKPISVGLLLGYGISLEDGPNPWGLGLGVRGGYNLDAIYLGARFVYYLGESEEIPDQTGGVSVEASFNIWELGIEGGYDIDAGGVVIRPGLGLGIANVSSDLGVVSISSTELYIAPGVSALFDVSDNMFVGAEGRFKIVLAEETLTGLILLANGGMRF